MFKVGQVLKINKKISESGLVKIVGIDNSELHPDARHRKPGLIVQAYDPTLDSNNGLFGSSFEITKEELNEQIEKK